jgi:hypothetical protein
MKNAKLIHVYLMILTFVVLFVNTAYISKTNYQTNYKIYHKFNYKNNSKSGKLSITNKTHSDIDEIHLNGGGDLIGDYEILHPNETIVVDFNCSKYKADTKIKVHLVFDDGKTYNYEDVVCSDGKSWNIEDDGN